MRQNKACEGAAGCLQKATSSIGAVLSTEEPCSEGIDGFPLEEETVSCEVLLSTALSIG